MPLVNTCPHPIRLIGADGTVIQELPRGAIQLRLIGEFKTVDTAYGVPVINSIEWDRLEGWDQLMTSLPSGTDIDLVVSMEVGKYLQAGGQSCGHIRHVYGPSQDPADMVRDATGVPIGTRRLTRYL